MFKYSPQYEKPDEYFTIKFNQLVGENEDEIMLTIINSSHAIQYKNEKSHNELLKTINATVNHEIRNPLNSIEAFNQQNYSNYNKLHALLNNENLTVIEMTI